MDDNSGFYVCFYKIDDRIIGHATAQKEESFKPLEDYIEVNANTDVTSENGKIFDLFSRSMMGYIDILPVLAIFGSVITQQIQQNELRELCDRCGTKISGNKEKDIYKLEEKYFGEYNSLENRRETGELISKQVPKMLMIGVVSSLDHLIAQLISVILSQNPSMISDGDQKIAAKDIFKYNSLDEFKEYLLDKEVDNLTRKSLNDQIAWIENKIGIEKSIVQSYPKWNALIEIVERRNLFAHANGIVNSTYIKNVSINEEAEKGQELVASPKYFKETIENISEFGIKLSQVVWRKMKPEEAFQADDVLGSFGFELIERGEYALAITVLEFAVKGLKGKKEESRRRMNIVNLANAYKLKGMVKQANDILDSEDWKIVSDSFAISVAAVRENMDIVLSYMKRLAQSAEWNGTELEEWPVFFSLRDNQRFTQEFETLFGRPFVPSPKTRYSLLKRFVKNTGEDDQPSTLKRGRIKKPSLRLVDLEKSDSDQANLPDIIH